jgi:hypothetical protein
VDRIRTIWRSAMYRRVTVALSLVAALSLLVALPVGAGDTPTYAGTIRSIDTARQAIVVEDVGPRMPGQPAPVTPRTVILTPSTEIFEARRSENPASGFAGDYEKKMTGDRSALTEGAFVSVKCAPSGDACRAVELTLIQTDRAA